MQPAQGQRWYVSSDPLPPHPAAVNESATAAKSAASAQTAQSAIQERIFYVAVAAAVLSLAALVVVSVVLGQAASGAFKNSDSANNNNNPPSPPPTPSLPIIEVKRLVVGSGIGGQYTAFRLSNQFPGLGEVALVSNDDRIWSVLVVCCDCPFLTFSHTQRQHRGFRSGWLDPNTTAANGRLRTPSEHCDHAAHAVPRQRALHSDLLLPLANTLSLARLGQLQRAMGLWP